MSEHKPTRPRDRKSGEHTACPERQSNGRPRPAAAGAPSQNSRGNGIYMISAAPGGLLKRIFLDVWSSAFTRSRAETA